MFVRWRPPSLEGVDRLLALLKLGSLYEIDDAKAFAMSLIESHPDIHPSVRLHASQKYGIREWLSPAFRDLLQLPLQSLTLVDVARLGFPTYSVLAVTKEKTECHRKQVAQTFPIVHLPYRHPNCYRAWSSVWWTEMGSSMLDDKGTPRWSSIIGRLTSSEMPNVCESCKPRYAHEVQEQSKEWLNGESSIIEEAVQSLLTLCS